MYLNILQSRKPHDVYILPHGLSLLLQELNQNTLKEMEILSE